MISLDELLESFLSKKDDSQYINNLLNEMETIDYKLYRYVSISHVDEIAKISKDNRILKRLSKNNQYGISSLVQSFLFHNKPEFFNDPFDCNFGMGINGFFMEIMDMFMDYKNLSNGVRRIEEEEMNIGLDNFRDYIKYMDIPDSLKNFLLFTFEATFDSIKEDPNDEIKMEDIQQKFMRKLLDNPNYLIDFLKPQLKTDAALQGLINQIDSKKDKLIESADDMKQLNLIQKPDFDGFFQVAGKMLNPSDLISATTKAKDQLSDYNKKIFSMINSQFGVCSLTQKFNDVLMWSHYADSHKGFLIEYDLHDYIEDLKENNIFLYPVSYQDERISIDENILQKINIYDISVEGKNTLAVLFLKGLLTKKKDWEIEKEWRSIKILGFHNGISDVEVRKVPSPKISGIYLGNKMPERVKKNINRVIRMNPSLSGVTIYEMINDISDYRLIPRKYDPSL